MTTILLSQGDSYVQAQCFMGHSTQVTSVEFNPKNTSLLCSCDDGGKVLYWAIGQANPRRISKAVGPMFSQLQSAM